MNIKIIMPSAGDMELSAQDGGTLELTPRFYGSTSMGPIVETWDDEGNLISRQKMTVSTAGKVKFEKQKETDEN